MIKQYLGIESDYIIIGIAGVCVLLLLLWIINIVQIAKLKKKYKTFMSGKDAKSLEELVIERIDKINSLESAVKDNERDIHTLYTKMKSTFQKVGLVKYDAFHEMGGKLSFSLCLLNESDDGFIINAMHSREGCYTYMKEIIGGNAIIALSDEEKEALDTALSMKK